MCGRDVLGIGNLSHSKPLDALSSTPHHPKCSAVVLARAVDANLSSPICPW